MHLFSSSANQKHLAEADYKFQTTCFPAFSADNSKGWCTIRRSGEDVNEQPNANSGWGFCSADPSQQECNGAITSGERDSAPHEVTFFDDQHCFDQLKINLEYEQPEAVKNNFSEIVNKSGTLCIGQIFDHSFEKEKFIDFTDSNYADLDSHTSSLKVSNTLMKQVD